MKIENKKIYVKKDVEYSLLKNNGFKPQYDKDTGDLSQFIFEYKDKLGIFQGGIAIDLKRRNVDIFPFGFMSSETCTALFLKTYDLLNKNVFEIK